MDNVLIKKMAVFAVALVCLYASLALFYKTLKSWQQYEGADFVSILEERIKRVLPFLGNETSVGYFFATDYQTAQARNFAPPSLANKDGEANENIGRGQIANYALRPLGVFTNLEKSTTLIITDFLNHPPQAPATMRLRDVEYMLVHDFDGGLSLYRRKP